MNIPLKLPYMIYEQDCDLCGKGIYNGDTYSYDFIKGKPSVFHMKCYNKYKWSQP